MRVFAVVLTLVLAGVSSAWGASLRGDGDPWDWALSEAPRRADVPPVFGYYWYPGQEPGWAATGGGPWQASAAAGLPGVGWARWRAWDAALKPWRTKELSFDVRGKRAAALLFYPVDGEAGVPRGEGPDGDGLAVMPIPAPLGFLAAGLGVLALIRRAQSASATPSARNCARRAR
ncbi:MAG: hypothetical protein AAGJ74_01795 [Pseudomonadota bacterium]